MFVNMFKNAHQSMEEIKV